MSSVETCFWEESARKPPQLPPFPCRASADIGLSAEITRQKITERRTAMLNHMSVPSEVKLNDRFLLPYLEELPHDIPMAMLYKVDKESVPGQFLVHLCGSIGVPDGHAFAVETANITSSVGLIPWLRESRNGFITKPVDESFAGIEWRGFQEPSKEFSVIPIGPYGFLVVGTNPRRPIDIDHCQFMREIALKATSIAASVSTFQESEKYKERLLGELESSERQIRFFAEHASVGMQNLGVDKISIWANEQFYKIIGLPRQTEAIQHKLSFLDMVLKEDVQKARDAWKRCLDGEKDVSSIVEAMFPALRYIVSGRRVRLNYSRILSD